MTRFKRARELSLGMSVKAFTERLKKGRFTLKMDGTLPRLGSQLQTPEIHLSVLPDYRHNEELPHTAAPTVRISHLPSQPWWDGSLEALDQNKLLLPRCFYLVFCHSNKKTNAGHWTGEWGCCCDEPDHVVCRTLEPLWKKNVGACRCGVRDYLEYDRCAGLQGLFYFYAGRESGCILLISRTYERGWMRR